MSWAVHEFGRAPLGDRRRVERLIKIAEARSQRPSASFPACMETPQDLDAFYAFCDNEHIKREAVVLSHIQATCERMAAHPVVLALQDTSYVDYSHHPQTTGLGVLHDKQHQGYLLHSTLVVTPEREPLGLLDQQVIQRDAKAFGKKQTRRQRPIEAKERYKWLLSVEASAASQAACPESLVVNVGDREADVYDAFLRAQQLQQPVLFRGAWNRSIEEEAAAYLWDWADALTVCDQRELALPKRGRYAARSATVSLRYGQVNLKPPSYRRSEGLPTLPVHVVYVREEQPPAHEPGLEWLLLTTVPVTDTASAWERVDWYACRWMIELYHKVLKSGCQLEARQLETADRLLRYLAIDSVVAWRILGLTFTARAQPELSCEAFLEPEEWQALYCFIHKTPKRPEQPPSLREASRWIAQLGGFLGRNSDGEPGITVMWRGYQRLSDIVQMHHVFNPTHGGVG